MRIHLDTDLGGDADDACALAMLLGSIKVVLDVDGAAFSELWLAAVEAVAG